MTDADFGPMAYRHGNAAQIRAALLASAKAGDAQGCAEAALVEGMRSRPNFKAETAFLRRYDAARANALLF